MYAHAANKLTPKNMRLFSPPDCQRNIGRKIMQPSAIMGKNKIRRYIELYFDAFRTGLHFPRVMPDMKSFFKAPCRFKITAFVSRKDPLTIKIATFVL